MLKIFIVVLAKIKIMKPQEQIKRNIKPKGLYNIRYIEESVGLRKLKLYAFLNNTENLSDAEALSVLSFIKNATKLQK